MIVELSNITPFISFGLNSNAMTAAVDEAITVWLHTLYNANDFDIVFQYQQPLKATVTNVSEYEHQISYNEAGTYELSIVVSNKEKTKTLTSNTITLIVE